MLKPQDVLVAIKLAMPADHAPTYPELAASLRISPSEAHASVRRAIRSGLVDPSTRRARRSALLEFLVHGLPYVFPPMRSGVTRGVPTSHAVPPLSGMIVSDDLPPVWPHAEGSVRGQGLAPLYKSVPGAALADPALHEWLALVDAIRAGSARERKIAAKLVEDRLRS